MKTFTLLCLILIITSGRIFATPQQGIPGRIQKVFHEEFPDIDSPAFFQDGNTYTVYFKKGKNSSERVYYNFDAEMIKTIKYYTERELEPFICEKVNRKYKGKRIISITEVLSSTAHFYQIILQENKSWCIVKSDAKGLMEIQKRWKGNV